ncbi:MAG: hypothetical protein OEZ38_01015 [Gammaproteobacteria bacterium]|nr:hypothetical protein [Gammaproteobacteria bacterium]
MKFLLKIFLSVVVFMFSLSVGAESTQPPVEDDVKQEQAEMDEKKASKDKKATKDKKKGEEEEPDCE